MKGDRKRLERIRGRAAERRDAMVDGNHAQPLGPRGGAAVANDLGAMRLLLSYGDLTPGDIEPSISSLIESAAQALAQGVGIDQILAGSWTDGLLVGLALAEMRAKEDPDG